MVSINVCDKIQVCLFTFKQNIIRLIIACVKTKYNSYFVGELDQRVNLFLSF